MGSNDTDGVMISRSDMADCSEATVEIKIKTLDSQTYTLRVDKCMPVPALKEQIATVTGVLSEQQRLICRGKVLKDDQLLSAYHVEDGHTLHMVVRQQLPPPSENLSDYSANDPSQGAGRGPNTRPSVVVGAFNLSEQGDGVIPDLSRIVSAVLGSFATNIGNGSEGADLREHLRIHGFSGLADPNRLQPDQTGPGGHSHSMDGVSSLSNAVPLEHLPLVIPDSLTTLSQYLSHMRHEFNSSVGGCGYNSRAADTRGQDGQESADASSRGRQDRLPTPGALAEVMLSTRQLLIEQAGECLSQLARQFEGHANITDPSARMGIQSNAMRSGDLLQKLGALLLELGRTTMTLRMGQAPGDAVVNAGPSVFISTSGPNPIMVQPLPFQQGTSFGAIPFGNVQPSSGFSGRSLGTGFLPRNIDIRIRAGSLAPSDAANEGEPIVNPSLSSSALSVNQAATVPGVQSSTREPEVRVLPIRTMVAAVPASVRRASSDSSRGPIGLFYPVLARVQQVTNGTLNGARGSQTSDELPTGLATEGQLNSEPTVRQESNGFPERDGNSSSTDAGLDGHGISTQIHGRLDNLLRTLFPGEQIQVGEVNVQTADSNSAAAHVGMSEVASGRQEAAAPRVTDEGIFLSNVLRQFMPLISENSVGPVLGYDSASSNLADTENRNARDSSTQHQENSGVGTSIHRENSPPTPPNSKRQKRE